MSSNDDTDRLLAAPIKPPARLRRAKRYASNPVPVEWDAGRGGVGRDQGRHYCLTCGPKRRDCPGHDTERTAA